jgi:hypothetical protein
MKLQIDFSQPNIGTLSELDTLDSLKLFRIVVQRLDAHLSSIVNGPGAARAEAARVFGAKKVRLNLQVIEERARKLGAVLARDWGITVSRSDLAVAVRAANPRR